MILFRILFRMIVVTIGFLLATAAATAALVAASQMLLMVPPEIRYGMYDYREVRPLFDGVLLLTVYLVVVSVSLMPTLLIALVTEAMAIRHLAFHLLAGGGVGLWAARPPFEGWVPQAFAPAIAAGFVGGFVYWIVAGRSAGLSAPAAPEPAQGPRPGRRMPDPPPSPGSPPAFPSGTFPSETFPASGRGRGRPEPGAHPPDRPGRPPRSPMPPAPPRPPVVQRRK